MALPDSKHPSDATATESARPDETTHETTLETTIDTTPDTTVVTTPEKTTGTTPDTSLETPGTGEHQPTTAVEEGAELAPAEWEEGLGLPEEAEAADEEAEAALDQILAERMRTWPLEGEATETTDAADHMWPLSSQAESNVIALRRSDEFVCSKCFLVKRKELLADAEHCVCRDCAA